MLSASLRELVIVVVAMGVVAVICRWVFTPVPRQVRRQAGPPDYGLLVSVTRSRTAADAVVLRDHLLAEGVRASVTPEHDVLVFQSDLDRARSLVGAS